MSLPALTHHEIVRLVEPFARQGRLVDLAASDRATRRIAFRPRDVPGGHGPAPVGSAVVALDTATAPGSVSATPSAGAPPGSAAGSSGLEGAAPAGVDAAAPRAAAAVAPCAAVAATPRPAAAATPRAAAAPAGNAPASAPPYRETLVLECRADDYFILLRTLTPAQGPAAVVRATGPDPADLLARVDAVPVAQLFSSGPGWRVARSYDTELPSGVRAPRAAAAPGAAMPPLVLSRAELQAGGLVLELRLKLPGLRSVAADLTLNPAPGTGPLPALPEDLLAVLGWDWARLVPDKQGWTSKLRLRGAVLRRSRTAERALDQAGAHLARVMAAAPARFHDEHRLARWGVVLRRGLPTLTAVGMVAGALLLTQFADRSNTGMWMALHYVPIALLALAFSLQELAQFEIPPLPRRSPAPGWAASDTGALRADRPVA